MMTKWILRAIARADAGSVDAIVEAAMARKRELYPDWELLYAALPREDGPQRREMRAKILRLLEKEEPKP